MIAREIIPQDLTGFSALVNRDAPFAASAEDLPHDIVTEQGLLGAVLIDNDCLGRLGSLQPGHFFDPVHRAIYEKCRHEIREGRVASPVTLKRHFDGYDRIEGLTVPE